MATRSSARGHVVGLPREAANGSSAVHHGQRGLNGAGRKLGKDTIERRFTELTRLLYDTSVPVSVLRDKVHPYLSPDIEFWDPWVRVRGLRRFWTGLRGFHAVIRFDFVIHQLAVELDESGRGGRVLVDGVMNLNQLVVYTYPLRTVLVYEFELSPDEESFQVTSLEEMWSLGDLIENLPGVGRLYEGFRLASGYVIGGLFWLAATLAEKK